MCEGGSTQVAGLSRRAPWASLSLACVVCVACHQGPDRPGGYEPEGAQAGSADGAGEPIELDSGVALPPAADAGGYCGNQIIAQDLDIPNLYFVLDRSGSMAELSPDSGQTKFEDVAAAIGQTLLAIGHRVRYGAAVFPELGLEGQCAAGAEVFEPALGDPVDYAVRGELGPRLTQFINLLGRIQPAGMTPTAATLEALRERLTGLDGETAVVLATDGAPNCGEAAGCDASDCGLVHSRAVLPDLRVCSGELNCCSPSVLEDGPVHCVDRSGLLGQVSALAETGIPTFVVGMPGSEYYRDSLNELAVAGRTERDGDEKYFPVSTGDELLAALRWIGLSVAYTCEVRLEVPPPDSERVNVYFDHRLVPADEVDGWTLEGDRRLELRGEACEQFLSGETLEIQVVAGCETVVN